jgi:1-acyl-sn-glycerol-3-phosphate acyltransferase
MRFLIAVLSPFVWLFCRLVFKIKFFGVENIPPTGACIITPNHVTYIDPIWITIPVKRRIYYMAWDKPFRIPVLGLLMRMFGAFPVNLDVAADASAQREAIELLRKERALVIFPEGGRTRTGKLMPFKMGAFRMALAYGIPILPVSIEGGGKIWPASRLLPRPGKLTITYHPAIPVERINEDTTKSEVRERARRLAKATHDVVASALDPSSLPEERTEALPVENNA